MGFFPQTRIRWQKGRWFHNLIWLLDRLDLAPAYAWLVIAVAAVYAASSVWPGHGLPAGLVSLAALAVEAGVLWWGNASGRSPGPFGGPFFQFMTGHAVATALVPLLPVSLGWMLSAHVLLQAGLLCGMLYASLVEPFRVQWREVDVELPGAPAGGLKILLVSDLHLDRRGIREDQVLELARSFAPDLVLWPGDFTNLSFVGDGRSAEEVRDVMAELCRLAPVYASRGTPEVDGREWVVRLVEGTGAVFLDHESAEVTVKGVELCLVGVPCAGEDSELTKSLTRLVAGADSIPVILLHHSPDLIEAAADLGVFLYVAGHTHGGQIRLPVVGAFYTASRYRGKYAWGSFQVGRTALVVSRGIGLEGAGAVRMRFGCPPEVVGINLRPGGG